MRAAKCLPALAAGLALLAAGVARAAETVTEARLQGAWSIDSGICADVFVFEGGKPRFSKKDDIMPSGFIVDGRNVRGLMESCRIVGSRAAAQSGKTFSLACATSVSDLSRSETARMPDDDTLILFDPAMADITITYYRCKP